MAVDRRQRQVMGRRCVCVYAVRCNRKLRLEMGLKLGLVGFGVECSFPCVSCMSPCPEREQCISCAPSDDPMGAIQEIEMSDELCFVVLTAGCVDSMRQSRHQVNVCLCIESFPVLWTHAGLEPPAASLLNPLINDVEERCNCKRTGGRMGGPGQY